MCVIGILLNYLLSTLNGYIGLPLYLDSVGTVLISMTGGYIPGILVGFLTNLILSFRDSTMIYYGCINVLLAAGIVFLTRRGFFGSILKTVISILRATIPF